MRQVQHDLSAKPAPDRISRLAFPAADFAKSDDILSTGGVSGLFAKDEVDAIIGDMRPVAKKEAGKGFVDSADNLWKYFLQRARANLHIVLCMSPVGVLLSTRTRKFPGLINCTTVDWFR